ncbi:hypothetical protein [Campylobacter sp. RM16192]|uniref:hypothetical protein n=1 Tax=Campylobacter sp. RM16192 TaxID=1660080 RepID=UPI001639AF78|nr:hypothetical protein [Campylobacter sp. RM16192]
MDNNIGFQGFGGHRDIDADFQGGRSLVGHFGYHGGEMGFATQSQYLQGARNFLTIRTSRMRVFCI